jgi:hypothetical protein
VPPERYLLPGGERDNSMDSRWHGFVARREIIDGSRHVRRRWTRHTSTGRAAGTLPPHSTETGYQIDVIERRS